jgi:K+-transporting ATPase KdpF subunit
VNWLYLIGGALSAALLLYLTLALMKAEWFS